MCQFMSNQYLSGKRNFDGMLVMRQHLPYLYKYNYNLFIMQYNSCSYLFSVELNLRIDLSFSSCS